MGSNACIGETLVKLHSTDDALTPLKEAAAITHAEQQRLQRQQEKLQVSKRVGIARGCLNFKPLSVVKRKRFLMGQI